MGNSLSQEGLASVAAPSSDTGSQSMAFWRSGTLLWLFCGIWGYLCLLLLAISISSGLYLLAELAEEYPTLAGVILKRYTLPVVVGVHIVLWVDGLPTFECFLGLLAHACYWKLLESYPMLSLKSYEAPLSLFMFLLSHYFWFVYFTEPNVYGMPGRDILHIIGFFVVLVWSVPMGLFVTLTISDNVLPGSGNSKHGSTDHLNRTAGSMHKKGANVFKTVYDFFQHIIETAAEYSYTGSGKVKKYKSPGGNGSSNSGGGSFLHEQSSTPSFGGATHGSASYGQPGQYNASQFTTNRMQAQHVNAATYKPAPSAVNRGKAD